MAQGWISIHRQIKDCWIWKDKPFSKGQAWIDLLLSANHQDNKISIGNKLITIAKGSFITSEVKLSERWGWSRKKVRCFLDILEKDEMLVKKSTSKYTSVTIVNYGLYQNEGTREDTAQEHQRNIKRTSKEHQKNTNNNDNNDNNENNDNKLISDFDKTFNDYRLMRKKIKKPMTEKAEELILKKLDKLSNSNEDVKIRILEQSIENSWIGVFPLKRASETTKKTQYDNMDEIEAKLLKKNHVDEDDGEERIKKLLAERKKRKEKDDYKEMGEC